MRVTNIQAKPMQKNSNLSLYQNMLVCFDFLANAY